MRLLLDAHCSPAVSRPLRAIGIDAWTLDEWLEGTYRHAEDVQILAAAVIEVRTLVTYDCKTMPGLLGELAATGRSHSGVILVDERTIRQHDFGGLIRALRALVERHGDEPWTDRMMYLSPV